MQAGRRAARERDEKNRHVGRKARRGRTDGTLPGKVFFLAILSAIPILFLFIVAPLISPGGLAVRDFPTWRYLFFLGTPVAAISALVLYRRAPDWAREHGAAKAGRMLALANGALWLFWSGLWVYMQVAGRMA